ncbi:hypothetical protein WOC76_12510 [Methylocystis sp. IM3]
MTIRYLEDVLRSLEAHPPVSLMLDLRETDALTALAGRLAGSATNIRASSKIDRDDDSYSGRQARFYDETAAAITAALGAQVGG